MHVHNINNLSIEVNLLWALHQTHHSSEEFNLATGLRQSAFQSFGFLVFFDISKILSLGEANFVVAFLPSTGLLCPSEPCCDPQGAGHSLPVLDPHRAGDQPWAPGPHPQHSQPPQGLTAFNVKLISLQELSLRRTIYQAQIAGSPWGE